MQPSSLTQGVASVLSMFCASIPAVSVATDCIRKCEEISS
jgi:hypothetical protein